MSKLADFFKNESVFFISIILALISCFFAKPSIDYIDWQTFIFLFAIMLIIEVLTFFVQEFSGF